MISLRKYSVRFALLGLLGVGAALAAPSAFAGGHNHWNVGVSIGAPGFSVGYGGYGGYGGGYYGGGYRHGYYGGRGHGYYRGGGYGHGGGYYGHGGNNGHNGYYGHGR